MNQNMGLFWKGLNLIGGLENHPVFLDEPTFSARRFATWMLNSFLDQPEQMIIMKILLRYFRRNCCISRKQKYYGVERKALHLRVEEIIMQ